MEFITVCYTITNLRDYTQEHKEKNFTSLDNAKAFAAILHKCDDVQQIQIINGMTGEYLGGPIEIQDSDSNAEIIPSDRWIKNEDTTWTFDCHGINCDECPYYLRCFDDDDSGISHVSYSEMIGTIKVYGDLGEDDEIVIDAAEETPKKCETPDAEIAPSDKWVENDDGTWTFDCEGLHCEECPYFGLYCQDDTDSISHSEMINFIKAHGDIDD